ncbi:hypothetical protein THRCLA_09160 [Thraustotheca clavata]|uniref:Uncharacterized protein n=1 Tax=Thraustotheca clavata TaxID=74557 RepID=A0A1V9YYS3_9STRA|nr:hypothetical protein THRCLA_09160 [Thraustotheca clavata]
MGKQRISTTHADLSYLSSKLLKPVEANDEFNDTTFAKLDNFDTDRVCAGSSLPKLELTDTIDFEAGVVRDGEAPDYSSPQILALLFQYVVNEHGGINGLKYPVLTGYFNLQSNDINSATALLSLGLSLKVFFGVLSDLWLTTAILLVILALKPAGAPALDPAASSNEAQDALMVAYAQQEPIE